MKWAAALVFVASLAALAFWQFRSQPPSEAPMRTVAFDNVYGEVAVLPVHVQVDGGAEQAVTATCDAKTCAFKLPLTNARHELLLIVEQQGKRSAPTRVTLDTSELR